MLDLNPAGHRQLVSPGDVLPPDHPQQPVGIFSGDDREPANPPRPHPKQGFPHRFVRKCNQDVGQTDPNLVHAGRRRRRGLRNRFKQFLARAFVGRIHDFDQPAARSYGDIMGNRWEIGRPMSVPDGQIAAIACSRGLAVATRNVADFEDCGLALVNPFNP